MTLTIRRATPDDAETVAALGRGLNEHLGEPIAHFTADAVRRDLADPAVAIEVLLAERDGAPVGYALFHTAYTAEYAASGLYMVDLFVVAAERHRGLGRTLVAAVAAEAKARVKTHVWWCSKPDNRSAPAFYRAIGAVAEPMIAHAVSGVAFESLAAVGAESADRSSNEPLSRPRPSDIDAKSRGRARASRQPSR